MKTIYIPVSVEDTPNITGYYFTPVYGTLKYFTDLKEWWYDGVKYKPTSWLKPIQIPEDKLNEIIKSE